MTSAVNNAPAKKKRRAKSLDKVRARAGWFFVIPFLIGFILIYLPIVFESIKSSFCTTHLLKGTTFVELWHHFAALGVFAVLFNILAAITYRKQS